MHKFKVGDWIKRTGDNYKGVNKGDTKQVVQLVPDVGIRFYGDNVVYDQMFFELVQDEKESTSAWLKENKWWIRCKSQLEFELINNWLEENACIRCQCNPPESCKIITNFNSNGMKNYVMWNDRDNYPKESEITLEFETVVKSVKLPEVAPKPTEQELHIIELEATISKAQEQVKKIKEEM